jgi:acyl-coenzyme A synthetase/AMP-(fatty) acid ligase
MAGNLTARGGIPLLVEPSRVVAWRAGRHISGAQFAAHAVRLADTLPVADHALNTCHDRYAFAVAIAACALRGVISLLPPVRTPFMVSQLRAEAPDLVLLSDRPEDADDLGLPLVPVDPHPSVDEVLYVPDLPSDRLVARMYSSGSTGRPQPHDRRWGSLALNGVAQAQRFAEYGFPRLNFVGTVPPQHSYGLESTVLIALAGGGALSAARPFYPADIATALAEVPRPRALVTTPFHLRTLLQTAFALPHIDLVVSATAPLATTLAHESEARFAAPLVEVYGATETGQLATRRTTQGTDWRPYQDVRVGQAEDGSTWADGGHVPGRTTVPDLIERRDDGSFHLLGRNSDMVNIGGKRSSLAYLNQVLMSVPGVVDGTFFFPDEEDDGSRAQRLAAAVVAHGLHERSILAALRTVLDPVFLPRPLLLVDALPRSESSKLPQQALRQLARARRARGAA